jgi:hypothetical protein
MDTTNVKVRCRGMQEGFGCSSGVVCLEFSRPWVWSQHRPPPHTGHTSPFKWSLKQAKLIYGGGRWQLDLVLFTWVCHLWTFIQMELIHCLIFCIHVILWQNFFLFCSIGVWTQGFVLAKQMLYHLSHTSSPFCSGYFGDGSLMNYLPGLASNCDPPHLSFPRS